MTLIFYFIFQQVFAWSFKLQSLNKIYYLEKKSSLLPQTPLSDQFTQSWHSRLENSSRASFYSHIANFRFQPYLDVFKSVKLCSALTRLRVSSHRLMIETGRWQKPSSIPINERKCITCSTLEDEFHFVLECQLYKDLRQKFIHISYWHRPNMFKFITLINSENTKTIKNLGLFIFYAFKIKNEQGVTVHA